MAGIHQTLKEARSLYAEALKLQEAVLASHRDLKGCVAQVQTWHEQVKKWLAKHPRFHFHFIPTSSSWLNLVERWFRELTQKRIRRGVFRSVPELEATIHEYLEASNQAAKPFIWTAPAQDILAKVERAAKTHAIVQNR